MKRKKKGKKQFADKIIEQFCKHEFRQSTDTFRVLFGGGRTEKRGACGLVKIDMT